MIVTSVAITLALLILVLLVARPRLGIAALAVFYPFNQFVPTTPLPGVNSETILFAVAIGMTLMRFGGRFPPLRVSGPIFAYLLILIGSWAITLTWYGNVVPGHSNWTGLKLAKNLALATVYFYLAFSWFPTVRDRRFLLEALSMALMLVALVGVADFVLGLTDWGQTGRATGVLRDPNVHAALLGFLALVPLYLLHEGDLPIPRRMLHLGSYGVAMLALVLTLSRGGWLAALFGHAVWFLLVNRRLLLIGGLALVFCATLAYPLLPGLVRNRVEETFQTGGTIYGTSLAQGFEASAGLRVAMWQIGWDMFQTSPIWGHGLKSFFLRTPRYGASYGVLTHKDPHNLIVRVAAETGLLGLAVFSWLVMVICATAYSVWRSGPENRLLGALVLAATAQFAMANMFATVAYQNLVSVYFWILLGMITRARVTSASSEETQPAPWLIPEHGGVTPGSA